MGPAAMVQRRLTLPFLLMLVLAVLVPAGCSGETIVVERQDREFVFTEKGKVQAADGACSKQRTFYADTDRDGYGDPKKPLQACTAPRGYVVEGTDCDDSEPRAFPGQKQFFATARTDGSFDFDCDGLSSVRLTLRAACEENPETRHCAASSGWDIRSTEKIPNCGEAASWAWNECRTELITDTPVPGAPSDPAAPPVISIPSPQKTISRCWSGKLAWKKRQLCR